MISVTKPFFPPIDEYKKHVDRIWENKWLTNNGSLTQELTKRLKDYLKINYISPMANGTLPIQIALNLFADEGEVITTAFSYVATTSCIVWEKCTPIFVDIHPEYLTIDESKIEEAITDKTTAILATHVYGNPCNVEEIEKIAKKHNLKVIYDGAHAFGVSYKGKSIFNYGDVSTCSFHATKLFHTAEGGAAFCQTDEVNQELFFRHNFGHNGPQEFHSVGINAKMSELQAAMGLSVLEHMEEILETRKAICNAYDNKLSLNKPKIRPNTNWNYSYYPVLFDTENELLSTVNVLNENNIFPRRYFYPSLANLPYVKKKKLVNTDDICCRILCLPLYHDLTIEEVDLICQLINQNK